MKLPWQLKAAFFLFSTGALASSCEKEYSFERSPVVLTSIFTHYSGIETDHNTGLEENGAALNHLNFAISENPRHGYTVSIDPGVPGNSSFKSLTGPIFNAEDDLRQLHIRFNYNTGLHYYEAELINAKTDSLVRPAENFFQGVDTFVIVPAGTRYKFSWLSRNSQGPDSLHTADPVIQQGIALANQQTSGMNTTLYTTRSY
jgi:hypothetical protein